MPPNKPVSTMFSVARQSLLEQLCFATKRIMVKTLLSGLAAEEVWQEQLEKAKSEFAQIHDELARIPSVLLFDIVPRAIEVVDEVIAFAVNYALDERVEIHRFEALCHFLMRAVLFPCLYNIQFNIATTWDTRYSLMTNLDCVPNLTTLIIKQGNFFAIEPALIVDGIRYLPNLQVFEYPSYSTDSMIREMSRFCPEMKKLNVRESQRVSNCCVEYLIKMKTLEYLDVSATKIECTPFANVIRNLTEVKNIAWRDLSEYVLNIIDVNRLKTIDNFEGIFTILSILIERCPNLASLSLGKVRMHNIELITKLNLLTSLTMHGINHEASNVSVIYPVIGKKLKTLRFYSMFSLDMYNISRYCNVLETFIVQESMFSESRVEEINPEFPHFSSLRCLTLASNVEDEWFNSLLHSYVNLDVFHCGLAYDISDNYFADIVGRGGFSRLSELLIGYCGILSKRTAYLLLQHCPLLKVLGCLNRWSKIVDEDISEIKAFIKQNNYDVELADTLPISWHILVDMVADR